MTSRSFTSVAEVLAAYGIPIPATRQRIFAIHDPLKDLDDTVALVAAAGLHHAGLVEIVGALGVLKPASVRARALKGVFVELGLPHIPVGVGSDITDKEWTFDYETCGYLAPEDSVIDGVELLDGVLRDSNDLTLVVAAGMTDLAKNILRRGGNGALLGVNSIVIMGGVNVQKTADGFAVILDKDGYMTPDTAANNAFDPEAAATVYRFCQEVGIPLTILTREAAYACQVNLGEFYTAMAATGSPIGHHLVNAQAPSLRALFASACEPEGGELRGKLPMRCDRTWFIATFCQGNDPGETTDIWPHVTAGQAYDLMAFLASVPAIRNRFFSPILEVVDDTFHEVIGLNQSWDNGEVADVDGLRNFMHELCIATLLEHQRRTA